MANDEILTTDLRLMPERWFYGETMHWLVSGVARNHSGFGRALAPGERSLGAFILPPFQRPPVWTTAQKAKLIESIYMGLPIGAIVYNQTATVGPCDRWLLDGQQRITSIVEYIAGTLPVRGWLYPNLPERERRHFDRMGIAVIETRISEEHDCRDIYERLAYGGTAHTREVETHGQ